MGTAFDDFIKQQKSGNPTPSKPTSYAHKAKYSSHSLYEQTRPVRRPPAKILPQKQPHSSNPKTEFSGEDFQPKSNVHPEAGYPKGFWNVLIVFFVTFFEELWHGIRNSSSYSSWDSDPWDSSDSGGDSGGGDGGD